ncbi:MAG: DUF1015 family protein [bacterium]|nr:DUF1015 family protein [bacterium]
MLRVNPFHALRPTPELASEVASVPYDVCDREEAVKLAEGKPRSFLHVVRPDIDLPADCDPYADEIYETAKKNFQKLIEDEILIREGEPSLYLYRQEMTLAPELGGRVLAQTGVVGCCHIDDYNNNVIKKHEKTRQDKEDDRTRHVLTLNANAGPVFLLHKNEASIQAMIDAGVKEEPLYDFTAVDGVRHTVWRIEDPEPYVQAYRNLKAAYVADGHHRSASAARAGAERRKANPNHTGNEEYNWFLSVLFPADELNILPYNRYVKDLNGLSAEQLINKIGAIAQVEKDIDPQPRTTGCFGMYVDGQWYSITLPAQSIPSAADDPIGNLDYVLLYDRVLAPILGIGDIRTDKRIDFVGGIRGTKELERRVNQGGGVAFAMHPVTIKQLTAVSDAGEIMPPKSTWFEPKLRSGLLVHTLD